jgi:hypothetical protein
VSVIDVDISGFELHNMVRTPPPAPGEPPGLRVRKPFVSLNTPTAGTVYVGSKIHRKSVDDRGVALPV